MVFSGKIYDQVKENLDTFLFGFDKSQLDVSLFKGKYSLRPTEAHPFLSAFSSGAIKLESVNIKPNKAEKLMQSLSLPFSLKAGTVGQLEIKLNLMSRMFSSDSASNQMQVTLDNAFFIIGPSMRIQSRDESYLQENEQEMQYPYDENNAFNIFENNLKLRKKSKSQTVNNQEETKAGAKSNSGNSQQQPGLSKEQKDMMKGLMLVIRNLHLRYEDDYYSSECPYSCGLVIEELRFEAAESRLFFERLAEFQAKRQDFGQMGSHVESQLCKDFNLHGVRFYWNCMSEMYIPTSLWESTRHMKYQIFEAMDAQQLNDMMVQVFTDRGHSQFQFINQGPVSVTSQLHSYDSYEQPLSANCARSVTSYNVAISSPLDLHLNPFILNDMQHFVARMQSQWLIKDLKQYRPHRRPLTDVPKHLELKATVRRKRKLIVRDWFFFVVWYVRLRKIITDFYQKDDKNGHLLYNSKYSYLLHEALNKECTLDELVKKIQVIREKDADKAIQPYKNEFNVRMQSLSISYFNEQLFESRAIYPKLGLSSTRLALHLSNSAVPSLDKKDEQKYEVSAQLNSFEMNTFNGQKFHSQVKPRQLSQMYLKQDVLIPARATVGGDQRVPSNSLSTIQSNFNSRAPYNAAKKSIAGGENYQSSDNQIGFNQSATSQYQSAQNLHQLMNLDEKQISVQVPPLRAAMQSNSNYLVDDDESKRIPNVTSPGRAMMIGPKVNSDQLIPMQLRKGATANSSGSVLNHRHQQHQPQPQQPNESKESLVSNMLLQVSRFLGGSSMNVTETPKTKPVINVASESDEYGGVDGSAPPTYNSYSSSPSVQLKEAAQTPQAVQRGDHYHYDLKGGQLSRAGTRTKNNQGKAGQQRIGLDVLMRQRAARKTGGLLNNSFNRRNNMQTESNQLNQMDMSTILGSAASMHEENDVHPSSTASRLRNGPIPYQQASHAQVTGIQAGIRNQNYVGGASDSNTQSVLCTPGKFGGNQSHQVSTSTLGQLLHGQQSKTPTTETGLRAPTQINTNRPQTSNTVQAYQQPIASRQQQVISADSTCNVLPTSQLHPGVGGVVRERFIAVSCLENDPGCCSRLDYKLVSDQNLAKEVAGELSFGKVEVTYSHNALMSAIEVLVGIKNLPMFRDLNLVPSCLVPKTETSNRQQASDQKHHDLLGQEIQGTLSSLARNRSLASMNKEHKKLKQVGILLQKCHIDLKVRGDRVYISLFDDQNRNQLAKFVSPPISLAVQAHHPRQNPGEASFEVFGFQAQQSTDLNFIGNFTGMLFSHLQMFATNQTIQRGQICYNQIIESYRHKEDEKRFITQQIARKQSIQLQGQISAGMLNDFSTVHPTSEGTIGKDALFGTQKQPVKKLNHAAYVKANKPKPSKSSTSNAANSAAASGTTAGLKKNEIGKQLKSNAVLSSSSLFMNLKKEFGAKGKFKGENAPSALQAVEPSQVLTMNQGLDGTNGNMPRSKGLQYDSSDDADLREKHETGMSDEEDYVDGEVGEDIKAGALGQPRSDFTRLDSHHQIQNMPGSLQQRQRSLQKEKKSQSYQNLETICQLDDKLDVHNAAVDIQELNAPKKQEFATTERASFSNATQVTAQRQEQLMHEQNNKMKQQSQFMIDTKRQNFLDNVAIGNPQVNPALQIAAVNFDQPVKSNTNTDSAGGEAFDNNDEDVYRMLQSQPAKHIPCDQDVPLIHSGHENYFKAGSIGNELNIGYSESGSETNRLTANLPMIPRASEQPKRWKNTRDSSAYMPRSQKRAGAHSKSSARDSSNLAVSQYSATQITKHTPNRSKLLSKQQYRLQNNSAYFDQQHSAQVHGTVSSQDEGSVGQLEHSSSVNNLYKNTSTMQVSKTNRRPTKKLMQSGSMNLGKSGKTSTRSPQRKKLPFQI